MDPSFWNDFLASIDHIKEKNPIYFSILKDSRPSEVSDNRVVLTCSSAGAKNYLSMKRVDIETLLQSHFKKNYEVTFVTRERPLDKGVPLLSFEPSKEDVFKRAGLNPQYSIDNFAVSTTNQVAFAAAQAVAKNPGTSYNPLFLYGGVGVGKTHLAQAVAKEILKHNSEFRVCFCSGEKFMNDLIESIRAKATSRFRKKYRALELIIIDDIQFIAGKQTVQEEFFHTFNSIVSSGGQIILTSDKPPHDIRNLEDRLRSRFSGGLIVDIQEPNFELRTAILLIKAKEKNIEIDIDAAKAIAEMVHDARALEGSLLSLYARSLQSGGVVDLNLIEDFFKSNKKDKSVRISPQDIIKSVCAYYNVRQVHLRGSSRKSEVALARQIVMYFLREELGMNLEEVAHTVRRKDHTTVMHAVNKIKKMTIKDATFKKEIDAVAKSFMPST